MAPGIDASSAIFSAATSAGLGVTTLRRHSQHVWWKDATVYQIYPASFYDSNGDGIGDLNGITLKLDYLKDLGVDVVWLSPIYKSPLVDMGYDISDYQAIDPRYGSLEDWDMLIEEMHRRKMKLMMDLVVNHTSNEHAWFKESRSSKSSSKRDWYIWRPAKYDAKGKRHPPNNWKSHFQGSAWAWDETTEEYYLHLYCVEQPDLNWENGEVRSAIWDMMRFWLDRGTDGFRMDVINLISKEPGLPDAPVTIPGQEFQPATAYYSNGPHVHKYLKEMRQEVLSKYPHLITVGETPYIRDELAVAQFVLPENCELDMVFQFELMDIDCEGKDRTNVFRPRNWKLPEFKQIVNKWQTLLHREGFWNSVYLENHDLARSVSRFGNDSALWRARSAKMLAILQISQAGTLYVFQGEEIAMANIPRSWTIDEYKDISGQNYYNKILNERIRNTGWPTTNIDMSDILDGLQKKARDNGRTPVQWDTSRFAGFSSNTPWMRVNDDFVEWNVANQQNDPDSVLNFWKRALKVRKENEVLIYGDFQIISETDEAVFAIRRQLHGQSAIVLLNFSDSVSRFTLAPTMSRLRTELSCASLVLANYSITKAASKPMMEDTNGNMFLTLKPYDGRIYLTP